MKKIIGLFFAAVVMVCGLSTISNAQSGYKPRVWQVNKRQSYQEKRINKGIYSGELTLREAARLTREQAQINRLEQRFRNSGGRLSAAERVRLAREQNQASRHIYRQKHDKQDYPRSYSRKY